MTVRILTTEEAARERGDTIISALGDGFGSLIGYRKRVHVAALHVTDTPADGTSSFTVPLYRVEADLGRKKPLTFFMDHEGNYYSNPSEWRRANTLPGGRIEAPKDLSPAPPSGGTVEMVRYDQE
jgi:hypothetical protein